MCGSYYIGLKTNIGESPGTHVEPYVKGRRQRRPTRPKPIRPRKNDIDATSAPPRLSPNLNPNGKNHGSAPPPRPILIDKNACFLSKTDWRAPFFCISKPI